MGNFFYGLYLFFEQRKFLLWSVFVLLVAGSGYLVSKLRTEEQITRGGGKVQEMAANIRLTDNLIIRIFSADTVRPAGTSDLAGFARALSDSLQSQYDSTFIESITPNPDDTGFNYLSRLIIDRMPVFLSACDYPEIDRLTAPSVIRQTMNNNFRLLTTPAGMVMRERILTDPLGISGLAMAKMRMLKAGDQYVLIEGYIFTSDERNLLLFLTSANPVSETGRNGQLLNGLDDLIAGLEHEHPGIRAEYWGGIAMAVGNATQLKKDIILTISLAIFFIFLLLAWYFRNAWIPLIGFIPALFGGLIALAAIWLIKGSISAISLGMGSVMLGLIVDYALYVINRYRNTGSVEMVVREMSQSIILCAVNSIGAFLCLLFLDSAVLADLGLFAALSIAGAAIFALVFLPHLLGKKVVKWRGGEVVNWVDKLSAIAIEKKTWFVAGMILAGIVSAFFVGQVKFEEDMNALNFVTPKVKAEGEVLDRISEVSLKTIYAVAEADDLDGALSGARSLLPEITALASQGVVHQFSGVQELMLPDSIQKERIARWTRYWTPDKVREVREAVSSSAKELGIKPVAFDPFFRMLGMPPAGLSAQEQQTLAQTIFRQWIAFNHGKVYVTTNLRVPGQNRESVYGRIHGSATVTLFDRQQMTQQFVEGVRKDFDRLVMLTMIFVTLWLMFSFGRIETGLITALPMYAGWLLTLGFMGLTGIRFNIFNIIISSFIFGLGVDYSILMMRGLLHQYKYGNDVSANYKVSIFLSSATTLIGVAVLFFAKHPALNSIALISVFGVTAVVLITWTIEPLLVKWMLSDRKAKGGFPVFARAFIHSIFIAWIPITSIAVILVIYATLISPVLPLNKKKKQDLFHRLFTALSRFYIATNFPKYHHVENPGGEDFSKPAIIIANHQSLIETPALLRLNPNIIILTNEWVFHHWVFGPVARVAGFIPIRAGIEDALGLMKERTDAGYSILIFPEGSRSKDGRIQRFHRGAFYVAEKLQLDILPVLIFGSGDFLRKTDFWGKPNRLFMKIMPRITPSDTRFGTTYQERARGIRKYYQDEYANCRMQHATPSYYRRIVIQNYLFKGPVLEWYVRIKMTLEDNFRLHHEHLPKRGQILDLGCGYGYMTYMLALTCEERHLTGVDHDAEKILVAQNCHSRSARTEFACADITAYSFPPKDGIILGDVLHYLTPDQQVSLLHRCMENLSEKGVLLVREGFRENSGRHGRTRITEFFSTRIMGFNKTPDETKYLHFMPESTIREIAAQHGMKVDILAEKRGTSNKLLRVSVSPW